MSSKYYGLNCMSWTAFLLIFTGLFLFVFLLRNSNAPISTCWLRHALYRNDLPFVWSWIDFHWGAGYRWQKAHVLSWQWKPQKQLPVDFTTVTSWSFTSFHASSPWKPNIEQQNGPLMTIHLSHLLFKLASFTSLQLSMTTMGQTHK